MDRKIVEYLAMGKSHRWIKEQLSVWPSVPGRARHHPTETTETRDDNVTMCTPAPEFSHQLIK